MLPRSTEPLDMYAGTSTRWNDERFVVWRNAGPRNGRRSSFNSARARASVCSLSDLRWKGRRSQKIQAYLVTPSHASGKTEQLPWVTWLRRVVWLKICAGLLSCWLKLKKTWAIRPDLENVTKRWVCAFTPFVDMFFTKALSPMIYKILRGSTRPGIFKTFRLSWSENQRQAAGASGHKAPKAETSRLLGLI